MRRVLLCLLPFCLALGTLPAQETHHPDSPVYFDIERWQMLGLIESPLPSLRPWPLQHIRALLKEAATNALADEAFALEAERASAYLERLPSPGTVEIALEAGARAVLVGDDVMTELIPTIEAGFFLDEKTSASADFTPLLSTHSTSTALTLPFIHNRYTGIVDDDANISIFNVIQDWDSLTAFGDQALWFQAGFNRSAVGPFFEDSVVLSPFAPNAGHFALGLQRGRFSFTALHLALIGRNILGTGSFTNKHLDFRSYRFALSPKLEIGIFESVIYGDRLELMYLVPFSFLFNMQGMTGWGSSTDNSFLGLNAKWQPLSGLAFMGELYVDDFPFNSFIRFNFNARYKLAGQLGLAWAPKEGPLEILRANYTAVLPYMYTHSNKFHLNTADMDNDDDVRAAILNTGHYSNYTHMGHSLGTDLLPNSERYALRARVKLPAGVTLRPSLSFERHGNASEDYAGPDANGLEHKGDLDDNGHINEYRNEGRLSLAETWRFLNQKVIELRLIAGLGADWSLAVFDIAKRPLGLVLSADYVFEYGWNRMAAGVPLEGNDGVTHYASLRVMLQW